MASKGMLSYKSITINASNQRRLDSLKSSMSDIEGPITPGQQPSASNPQSDAKNGNGKKKGKKPGRNKSVKKEDTAVRLETLISPSRRVRPGGRRTRGSISSANGSTTSITDDPNEGSSSEESDVQSSDADALEAEIRRRRKHWPGKYYRKTTSKSFPKPGNYGKSTTAKMIHLSNIQSNKCYYSGYLYKKNHLDATGELLMREEIPEGQLPSPDENRIWIKWWAELLGTQLMLWKVPAELYLKKQDPISVPSQPVADSLNQPSEIPATEADNDVKSNSRKPSLASIENTQESSGAKKGSSIKSESESEESGADDEDEGDRLYPDSSHVSEIQTATEIKGKRKTQAQRHPWRGGGSAANRQIPKLKLREKKAQEEAKDETTIEPVTPTRQKRREKKGVELMLQRELEPEMFIVEKIKASSIPISVDIGNAHCEVIPDHMSLMHEPGAPNPPFPYTSFIALSSSGASMYFLATPSKVESNSWVTAIRLSSFEACSLNQVFSLSLLRVSPYINAWSDVGIPPFGSGWFDGGLQFTGEVMARHAFEPDYKEYFCVVQKDFEEEDHKKQEVEEDPDKNMRKSYFNVGKAKNKESLPSSLEKPDEEDKSQDDETSGQLFFFESKAAWKKGAAPLFTMSDISSAYLLWPGSREVVAHDMVVDVKIHGMINLKVNKSKKWIVKNRASKGTGSNDRLTSSKSSDNLTNMPSQPAPPYLFLRTTNSHESLRWIVAILTAFTIEADTDKTDEDSELWADPPLAWGSLSLKVDDITGICKSETTQESYNRYAILFNDKKLIFKLGLADDWEFAVRRSAKLRDKFERNDVQDRAFRLIEWTEYNLDDSIRLPQWIQQEIDDRAAIKKAAEDELVKEKLEVESEENIEESSDEEENNTSGEEISEELESETKGSAKEDSVKDETSSVKPETKTSESPVPVSVVSPKSQQTSPTSTTHSEMSTSSWVTTSTMATSATSGRAMSVTSAKSSKAPSVTSATSAKDNSVASPVAASTLSRSDAYKRKGGQFKSQADILLLTKRSDDQDTEPSIKSAPISGLANKIESEIKKEQSDLKIEEGDKKNEQELIMKEGKKMDTAEADINEGETETEEVKNYEECKKEQQTDSGDQDGTEKNQDEADKVEGGQDANDESKEGNNQREKEYEEPDLVLNEDQQETPEPEKPQETVIRLDLSETVPIELRFEATESTSHWIRVEEERMNSHQSWMAKINPIVSLFPRYKIQKISN